MDCKIINICNEIWPKQKKTSNFSLKDILWLIWKLNYNRHVLQTRITDIYFHKTKSPFVLFFFLNIDFFYNNFKSCERSARVSIRKWYQSESINRMTGTWIYLLYWFLSFDMGFDYSPLIIYNLNFPQPFFL